MRFKRPQVRYADTPQPATPYQSAAQVWDERIGSARVQAKNWRFMAFGCLTLAVLMAGGLVWRSAQSIVTPYVIEVDNAGQVRAVGEAATPYQPSDAQVAYHLGRFIGLVRGVCSTVDTTAFQRSVRSSAPFTKRVSVQRTLKDWSLARVTLLICTVTDSLPMREKGSATRAYSLSTTAPMSVV
jgi:type IV secretory pathway TrbF-like protein